MVEGRFRFAFEFWDDLVGQDLAELDAPLVEAVDVPDDALGEDGVLVEGYQLAEGRGVELVGYQHVRGAVAFEDAVGFGTVGLTECQGFGLG